MKVGVDITRVIISARMSRYRGFDSFFFYLFASGISTLAQLSL